MKQYTTGDIAKLCGVTPRTVVKWIDRGLLAHYKVPNSKHRRIAQPELVAFLKANDMEILLPGVVGT